MSSASAGVVSAVIELAGTEEPQRGLLAVEQDDDLAPDLCRGRVRHSLADARLRERARGATEPHGRAESLFRRELPQELGVAGLGFARGVAVHAQSVAPST